jgi:hypothetical protein
MTLKKQMKRYLGKKATRRIYASAPWVGGALALAAGVLVQRRGLRGVMNDTRDLTSSVSETVRRASEYGERDRPLVGSR